MASKSPLSSTIDRLLESIDENAIEPLIRYLRSCTKKSQIDYDDLIEILRDMDLPKEQYETVLSVLGDYVLDHSVESINSLPPAFEPFNQIDSIDEINITETVPSISSNSIDSIRLYIKQVSQLRILSLEEELECGKKLAKAKKAEEVLSIAKENGQILPMETIAALKKTISIGERAKELLIERNLMTVIGIAKKYINSGMHFGDLIQEGNIGLLRAVERYDYRKGYRFNTYASWWIKQGIQRSNMNNRSIRLPANLYELLKKLNKTTTNLVQELGREPSYREIADAANVSERTVISAFKHASPILSLDTPISSSTDYGPTIEYFVPDKEDHNPGYWTEQSDLRRHLNDLMGDLTVREDCILRLRFGMEDGYPYTLEEIGKELSYTRERVRQIESGALKKLDTPGAKKVLTGFLSS